MGSIDNTKAIAAVLLLLGPIIASGNGLLYALEPGSPREPLQLGAEIQKFEQILSTAGAPPSARHDALVRLAQLRQLSGNIAIAAVHWLDAAAADPYDDAALVSGAYCLAAIGEWERAALSLQPLLSSGKTGPTVMQARYLDACLKALTVHDASALTSLSSLSEFASLRPVIYYTLWQIATRDPGITGTGTADSWKNRLRAEFPQSPEARTVDPEKQKDSSAISAIQSPLWLLFPGTAASPPIITVKPVEAPQTSVPTITTITASTAVLQTGLFGKEANARSQSDALRKAGFTSAVSRKLVNGTEYWAVTVPAGQNENKTIADLKKAGFDSFPVK